MASIGVTAVIYMLIQIGISGYVYRQVQLNETRSPLAAASVVLLLALVIPFILDGVLAILVIEAVVLAVYLYINRYKSNPEQMPGLE